MLIVHSLLLKHARSGKTGRHIGDARSSVWGRLEHPLCIQQDVQLLFPANTGQLFTDSTAGRELETAMQVMSSF